MKKKTLIILSAVLACVMAFSSCGKNKEEEKTTNPNAVHNEVNQAVDITLPYSSSDSLNPFFATGYENSAIAYLYCQPLFTVKNDYSTEPVIADSYNIDDRIVTVSLKPIKFSDSSTVKAKDVLYSFNKAKSSPSYSQRLSNVEYARVTGNSIEFTLEKPDAFALNILTFPVVREGTADKTTDIPVGSGSYQFTANDTLTLSDGADSKSSINTIKLNDIKKLTYITNELEIGNINYLFENFSSGNYKRIVAENKSVTLNNFVYIGINNYVNGLSSSAVRTAIYYAIDKQSVSASAYQGYSQATSTPFNPDFCELKGVQVPETKGDKNKCNSILEKTGYNRYTKNGARTNGTNNLQFTILVNSENVFRVSAAYKICDNLREVGIIATVDAVPTAVYQQRIASTNYQLYIGEVKLTENMDLSVFHQGSSSMGINRDDKFFTDYDAYRQGTIGMQETVDSFMDSILFVPLCYRAGMAAYTKTYTPDFSYAPFNVYANIENWGKSK